MALVEYRLDGHIAAITLNSGENRFNPNFLDAFLQTLHDVEHQTDATTLVVTSAHEKIFSNGIDLDWLIPVIQRQDIQGAKDYFYLLNRLFSRMASYPMITIAAINGHAFAGGAILCCAFDFRFMRSDRGFFCFPEVDLGIPFLPGMNALLKKAIPLYKLEEMEYTGVRMTADECARHHIITQACHIDDLMNAVMTFARSVNKRRPVIQEMKKRLNQDVLHAIAVEDVPYIESGQFNIG